MEKRLIALEVPSIGETFDIFVPIHLPVSELIKLFISAVVSLSDGEFSSSGKELLCRKNDRTVFDPLLTLEDYGIGNSERLMLF